MELTVARWITAALATVGVAGLPLSGACHASDASGGPRDAGHGDALPVCTASPDNPNDVPCSPDCGANEVCIPGFTCCEGTDGAYTVAGFCVPVDELTAGPDFDAPFDCYDPDAASSCECGPALCTCGCDPSGRVFATGCTASCVLCP